jgi:hypothetical protein
MPTRREQLEAKRVEAKRLKADKNAVAQQRGRFHWISDPQARAAAIKRADSQQLADLKTSRSSRNRASRAKVTQVQEPSDKLWRHNGNFVCCDRKRNKNQRRTNSNR